MSYSGRNRYRPSTNWSRSSSKTNLSFTTITEECVPKEVNFPEDEEKRERQQRLRKLQRLRERRYRDFKGLARSGLTDDYEERFAQDLEEFRNIRKGRHLVTAGDVSSANEQTESHTSIFQNKDIYNLPIGSAARRTQVLSPTGSVSSTATLDDRYMYSSRFGNEETDYSWKPRQRTHSLSTSVNRDHDYSLYGHINEDGLDDDNLFDDTASECDFGYNTAYAPKRSFSTCITPRKYSGMMTPVTMSTEAAATAERLNQITERLHNLQAMRKKRELSGSVSNDEKQIISSDKDDHNEHISTSASSFHSSASQLQSLNIPHDDKDSSKPDWSHRIDLLMSSQKQNETQHIQRDDQENYVSINNTASNVKIIDGSEQVPIDISFDHESFYSFDTIEDDSSVVNMKLTNNNNKNTEEDGMDYIDCADPDSFQISLDNHNNNAFPGFQSNLISENNTTTITKPIELTQHTAHIQLHSKQNDFSKAKHSEVQSHTKGTEMQSYQNLSRDELLLEIARLKMGNSDKPKSKTESNVHSIETKSQVKSSPGDKANINITNVELVKDSIKRDSNNIQNQVPHSVPTSVNNDVYKSVTITVKDSKLSEKEIQSKEQPQSDYHKIDHKENFVPKEEKSQIEHSMHFKSTIIENPNLETSENTIHKITDESKLQNQYSPTVKETFEKKKNFYDEKLEIPSLKDQQNNNSSLESCPLKTSKIQTQLSWNHSETSDSKNISSDSLATNSPKCLSKYDINFDNSKNLTDTLSKETTNAMEIFSQNYVDYIIDQASKEITMNNNDPTENSLISRKDEILETKKLSVDVTLKPNNDNVTKTKSPEKCNRIAYSSTEHEVEMPRVLASSPVFVPSQDTFPNIISKTTTNDNTESPSTLKTSQMNETDAQKYLNIDSNIKESEDTTKSIEIPAEDMVIKMSKDRNISEIPTDSKNDFRYFQTNVSTMHLAKEDDNSESYVSEASKEITMDVHESFSADQQRDIKEKFQSFQDRSPKSIIMPHTTENSQIIISPSKSSEPVYTSTLSLSLPNSPSELKKDNIDAQLEAKTTNVHAELKPKGNNADTELKIKTFNVDAELKTKTSNVQVEPKTKLFNVDGEQKTNKPNVDGELKRGTSNVDAELKTKTPDVDAKLKTKLFNVDAELKRGTSNVDAELKRGTSNVDADLKTKLFNVDAELKRGTSNVDAELKTKPFNVDAELKTKPFNVDAELKTKRPNVDAELKRGTSNVDADVKTKRPDVDTELKTKPFNVDSELKTKTFNVDSEPKTKTFNVDGELKTKNVQVEPKTKPFNVDGELKTKNVQVEPKTKPFNVDAELKTKRPNVDAELKRGTSNVDAEVKTKRPDVDTELKTKTFNVDSELKTKNVQVEPKTKTFNVDGELKTKNVQVEPKTKPFNVDAELKTKNVQVEPKTKPFNVDAELKTKNVQVEPKTKPFNVDAELKTKISNVQVEPKTKLFNSDAELKTNRPNFNAELKTKPSNFDAELKTKTFNGDAELKAKTFNVQVEPKTKTFNVDAELKTKSSNVDAELKTKPSNVDADLKTKPFNVDAELKTKPFNVDADLKTKTFNVDAELKTKPFNVDADLKKETLNAVAELKTKPFNVQVEPKTKTFIVDAELKTKRPNVDGELKRGTSNLEDQADETQMSLNGISSSSKSTSIYLEPNKNYLSTPTYTQNQLNLDLDRKSNVMMSDYSTTLEQSTKVEAPKVNTENYLTASMPESSFTQVVKTNANDSSTNQNEMHEKSIGYTVDLDVLHSKTKDEFNASEQPVQFGNKTIEPLNVSHQTTFKREDLDNETPTKQVNLKVYNEKYQDGPNWDFEQSSMIPTTLPFNSNNSPGSTESTFKTCQQENVSIELTPESKGAFSNYLLSSHQTTISQPSLTQNSVSLPSKIDSRETTNYAHSNFYDDKDNSSILLKKDAASIDLKDSSVLKSLKSDLGVDVNENDSQIQNIRNITSKNILLQDSPKETTTSKQNTSINIRKQLFGEEINTYDSSYIKPQKFALKLVAPDSGTLIKTKFETEGERIQSIRPRSTEMKDYVARQFSDNSEYLKSDTNSRDLPDSSFHIISDSQVVTSPKSVEVERPASQSDAQYLVTTSPDSLSTIQYKANSNVENVDHHTSLGSVVLSPRDLVPEHQLLSNSKKSEIGVELSKETVFPSEANNASFISSSSEPEYVNQNRTPSESDIKYLQDSPHLIFNKQPTPQDTTNNNENTDVSLTFPKTQNMEPSSPNIQKLESSIEATPFASNKGSHETKAPEYNLQKSNVDENNLAQNEQWAFEETTPNLNKSNSLPRKKKKFSKPPDSPTSPEPTIISAEEVQNINKKNPQKKWKSVEVLGKGNKKKPEVPPKNSSAGLVKSTSMKFLSKFQSKSKKSKNPEEYFQDEYKGKSSPDLFNTALKKGQSDYSVMNPEQNEFLDSDPEQRTRHYKTLPHKKKENYENAPVQYKSLKKDVERYKPETKANSLVSPYITKLPKQDDDKFIEDKQSFSEWDPSALFTDLYNIHLVADDTHDFSPDFIEMEGVMEKLPMNKKKSTLLKTWKRRYFIAKKGRLVYYDNRGDQHPSDEILLMGGNIITMDNLVIGIDDGRGHYLMVRCPSQKEYEQWLAALQSQIVENFKANYIQPVLDAPKSSKNIVIIELGSMSIRAGMLKEDPTLPQIFFPSVVAVNYTEKKHYVGFEAYKPNNRLSSNLLHAFGLSEKVDKFRIEYEILPSVFTAIFQDLKVRPSDNHVMLVLPLHVSKKDKENIMDMLMNRFHVQAVCMVTQAIAALYSYNTKSGIMVDIGERMEVIPIYDGFAIEGGQSIQSYGAGKIRQALRFGLAKHNFPLYSPLEQILVRQVMEQTCYVSKHYEEELHKYMKHPEKFLSSVYLNKYNMPKDSYSTINHDVSRFAGPEGFFNTDLWGMDYPTIQALVLKAIQACPMDNRRYMCRAIYLSGGVTMIPGFSARLEKEVQKLVNSSLLVQVHSSPQRYHAAYIGACVLSSLPEFLNHCISSNEWKREGTKAFRKWIF